MFAAIFNVDRKPIDPANLGFSATTCRILGEARHVALICLPGGSPLGERETSAIRALADGSCIVGRIRLDGRKELAERLGQENCDDAELCLRALAKWGDSFLDHLAGDFCFALWDEARGRLLAARDQLGVRSLFHARAGNSWILSDSLDWIASCRPRDGALDEYWIADFLSFGYGLEFDRTVWRDIRRLPPAHVMSVSKPGMELRRYWRLVLEEPLYLRDHRQYGERFHELALRAVADRLPPGRVGVTMSGGLDSTALAACAVEAKGKPGGVLARCFHYEALLEDDETEFSKLAAGHLGIDLELTAVDDSTYDPSWRAHRVSTAEPWASVVRARHEQSMLQSMAAEADVWFEGEGPDNALRFERDAYFSWLVRQRRWLRLAEAGWLYLRAKGLSGWAQTFRRYASTATAPRSALALPEWMDRDLVRQLHLEERLAALEKGAQPPHSWHPAAMASFEDPIWQAMFADFEVEESLAPLSWRHPFLDLRVLQFMLSLPPVPWARRKLVIRQAMRGRLPAAILEREKTPLRRDPTDLAMRNRKLTPFARPAELARWADLDRVAGTEVTPLTVRPLLAVHALDYWLAAR